VYKARKLISDILLESGMITQHQVDHALVLQKNKHKRLEKILVELGYVTEGQIAEVMSKQLSLPLVDCEQYKIPDDVKALVPKEMAEKRLLCRWRYRGKPFSWRWPIPSILRPSARSVS